MKFFAELPEAIEKRINDIKDRAMENGKKVSNIDFVVEGLGSIEKKIDRVESK